MAELSEETVRSQAAKFSQRYLFPLTKQLEEIKDEETRFIATRDVYEAMIAEGYLANFIPQKFGGSGLSASLNFAIVEEFAKWNVAVTLTMLATTLGLSSLMSSGDDELIDENIKIFTNRSGTPLAAFAFTEPSGSANYANTSPGGGLTSTARANGEGFEITGKKAWVSNSWGWDGSGPDLLTVVAKDEQGNNSAFLLPPGARGISYQAHFDTQGMEGHLLPRMELNKVFVPSRNILGTIGGGNAIVEKAFGSGAGVGALAVGVASRAFEYVYEWSKAESMGGSKPLLQQEVFAAALSETKIKLESARAVVKVAALAIDSGSPQAFELGLVSKIYATETAAQVVVEASRLMGVRSLSHEYPLTGLITLSQFFPLVSGSNNGFRRVQMRNLLQESK